MKQFQITFTFSQHRCDINFLFQFVSIFFSILVILPTLFITTCSLHPALLHCSKHVSLLTFAVLMKTSSPKTWTQFLSLLMHSLFVSEFHIFVWKSGADLLIQFGPSMTAALQGRDFYVFVERHSSCFYCWTKLAWDLRSHVFAMIPLHIATKIFTMKCGWCFITRSQST